MNSHHGLVGRYEALWIRISREKLLGEGSRAVVEGLVNGFFEGIAREEEAWLEAYDLEWKKPRAVLIKERALQIAQKPEGGKILKKHLSWLRENFEGLMKTGREIKH